MKRKVMPLFWLAAGVAVAIVTVGFLGSVVIMTTDVMAADAAGGAQQTAALSDPVGPEAADTADEGNAATTRSAVEQLTRENQVLLQQINQTETLLQEREAAYQAQWQQVRTELAFARGKLGQAESEQTASQQDIEALQQRLAAGDSAFQAEMQEKTAQLAAEEAQLRQQLELTYAELQAAYDQLGALPPPATYGDSGGSSGSSSSGSHESAPQDDDHHDDDDDDREHEDREHEDDDD